MQSGIVGAFVIVAPTWTQPDTSTPSTSATTKRVTTSHFNSNTQPGQLNGLRTGMACIRSRGESTTATQTTVQSQLDPAGAEAWGARNTRCQPPGQS